jgi:hypothetical protein
MCAIIGTNGPFVDRKSTGLVGVPVVGKVTVPKDTGGSIIGVLLGLRGQDTPKISPVFETSDGGVPIEPDKPPVRIFGTRGVIGETGIGTITIFIDSGTGGGEEAGRHEGA